MIYCDNKCEQCNKYSTEHFSYPIHEYDCIMANKTIVYNEVTKERKVM